MRSFFIKLLIASGFFLINQDLILAQDGGSIASPAEEAEKKKVQFNGLGRASILQTGISGNLLDTDTVTVESLTDGEFLLDLAINAQPNDKNEVQAILRLRNEFGGFFGSGVTVEVRELWARGVIANTLKYRVGDMDLAMTPYTLFLSQEEGSVNEAAVFKPQKEVIYYENFYTNEHTRRLQGAKLDFGLNVTKGLKDIDFSAFIARVRATNFLTIPTRFIGGGALDFSTQTVDSLGFGITGGINLINTWDDLKTGAANSGIRNFIFSADFDITVFDRNNLSVHLLGEGGQSSIVQKDEEQKFFDKSDGFFETEARVDLKAQNLSFAVGYLDVGPDFFSVGAQSKAVDFSRPKTYYNRVGNNRRVRMPTLFDLGRDQAIYNFQLSDHLMRYDPRYNNTQPYGNATPNRRGFTAGVDFQPDNNMFEAILDAAFLKEIRGQGTFELKNFSRIRASVNVNIHEIASLNRNLRFTLGYQYENTKRAGIEIEALNLSSNLIELGLEAELFSNFEVLLGAKILNASGSDYVPLIEEFNIIKDFPIRYLVDDMETLFGAGLKYTFREGIYITGQYQRFSLSRATNPMNDYNLSQAFVIYTMEF